MVRKVKILEVVVLLCGKIGMEKDYDLGVIDKIIERDVLDEYVVLNLFYFLLLELSF